MPMMRIIVSGADESGEKQFKRLVYYGPDTDTCTVVRDLMAQIGVYLTAAHIVGSYLVDTQAVDYHTNPWDGLV